MQQGKTITLFGGTGFLGRHLVPLLAREGYCLRLPVRSMDKALPLKIAGYPGQIVPFLSSVQHDVSVARALHGADCAINLIGTHFEKRSRSFQNIHVETAARIARLARSEGLHTLVHVSAFEADLHSPSPYKKSKAAGEKAIQAFFPEAILFRPTLTYGPDDSFLNRFRALAEIWPALPLVDQGQTVFRPVHVDDVARAILFAMNKPEARGKVFDLVGPDRLTLRAMIEIALADHDKMPRFVNLPMPLALLFSRFLEFLPSPPVTRDLVKNLVTGTMQAPLPSSGGFSELGIRPRPLLSSFFTR